MPVIIPVRELKNTAQITKLVQETDEPVFVTKNGYGTMVIMNLEVYERELMNSKIMKSINTSIKNYQETGESVDGPLFIKELKENKKN